MWCPRCANETTIVTSTLKGTVNERSRRCPMCNYTWMSIESIKTDKYWISYAKHTIVTEADEKKLKDLIIDLNKGGLFEDEY